MKRSLLLVLLLVGCTHGGIHIENDYLDPFQHNNDRYYTHGTRFDYKDNDETYSIGQNIYTPTNKRISAASSELARDRPYAGYLYGEYRRQNKESDRSYTTMGVQFGCIGPCSFAKETQQAVHSLLGQGKPAWIASDELRSEPGVILEYEKRKQFYGNDTLDFVGYGLTKFGNIIDSGSLGVAGRWGYNIGNPFNGETPIVFKLPNTRSNLSAYFFGTIEERGVAYNQLLQGSLWQREPHIVHPDPLVTELDAGLTVGYGMYRFTYEWTHFSTEWKHGSPFAFGGISIEW